MGWGRWLSWKVPAAYEWVRTWVQPHIKSCSMILESHPWGGRQEDPWRLLATYCSAIVKLHVQWGTSSQKLRWKETTTHRDVVTELPLYSILSSWLGAWAGSKDISICPSVWNQEPHTSRVCESQRSPVATVEHDWSQFHRQKTNSLQFPRSSWIPMWLILPSDSLYSSNFFVYKGKSVSAIKVMCPMMSQGKTEIHAIPHSSESYPQQEHSES